MNSRGFPERTVSVQAVVPLALNTCNLIIRDRVGSFASEMCYFPYCLSSPHLSAVRSHSAPASSVSYEMGAERTAVVLLPQAPAGAMPCLQGPLMVRPLPRT